MSVLDKLNAATRARRTYELCLDAGLQAEHDRLTAGMDAAIAADQQGASLAKAAPNFTAHVEAMEAVRQRMVDSTVTLNIAAPEWTVRLDLQAKHPPRKDNLADTVRGYNLETFLPALVKLSTVSIEDASGDVATEIPAETWDHLFSSLNFGTVNDLSSLVLDASDENPQVPPSARSLIESPDSGASLAQPSPGTSAPDASEAGSRPTSRRTSTTARKTTAKTTAPRSRARSAGQ